MNITLQDVSEPYMSQSSDFSKIYMMNGDYYFPDDHVQNDYHEFVLRTMNQHSIKTSSWKQVPTKIFKKSFYDFKKQIFEHSTKARNILCVSGEALSALHHCSYTLNSCSEIIPISSTMRANMIKEIYNQSANGYSITGVAIKKIESKFSTTTYFHNGIFIAYILHEYNLFSESSNTTDDTRNKKIITKIFSKELLPTCKWFARKIGVNALDDFCITSDILQSMGDAELLPQLNHTTIFAQMRPIDFERVSRLYTVLGHAIVN